MNRHPLFLLDRRDIVVVTTGDLVNGNPSGGFGLFRPGGSAVNGKAHLCPCPGQHVHQSVDAEEVDLSACQVTDPGLRDPEKPCCPRLCPFSTCKDSAELDHQLRAKPQVLRFLTPKTKVAKHVVTRTSDLRAHRRIPLSRISGAAMSGKCVSQP